MDGTTGHVLDRITATALAAGLSEDSARTACRTAQDLPLVSFSGWLLSGKDTVALASYRAMGVPHRHLSFATGIKDELDEVIGVLRVAPDGRHAAGEVAAMLGCHPADAGELVRLVLEGSDLDARREQLQVLDAYQRTPGVRRGLQYLGTEIRRGQDPEYWVRRAQRDAVTALAHGEAFVFTDVRFPGEVSGLQELGAKVVRLSISRDTQLERLRLRDGLDADPAALYHDTETALEGFDGFDVVLDNERPLDEVVREVVAISAS